VAIARKADLSMHALAACAASELPGKESLCRTFHTLDEAWGTDVEQPFYSDIMIVNYNAGYVTGRIH
jgi:hypothetical protein